MSVLLRSPEPSRAIWLTAISFFATHVPLSRVASGQMFVRTKKASVTGPTTIDWMYAASGVSHAEVPQELTPGYKPTLQRFDLYAPRTRVAGKLPVILFISFRNTPMGWDFVGPTCVRDGVIYIGPHGVGNSTRSDERIRIALDCLDEVRRNYPTDPDRTYIAGYSGGGYIAARIAMMLPEYFGGVIASNMVVTPPPAGWHRDRMVNRISVASIVGENEPPGLEMGNIHAPFLTQLGVRTRCQVLPRRGHAAPPPVAFDSAYRWLEQAAATRRQAAESRPVLRIQGEMTREQLAAQTLDDCKTQLKETESLNTQLQVLAQIQRRWPDLPESTESAELLAEYESRSDKPWLETGRLERHRDSRFLASAYESAARVRTNLSKVQRAGYALNAIAHYTVVTQESDDQDEVELARQRIEQLQPLADRFPISRSIAPPER